MNKFIWLTLALFCITVATAQKKTTTTPAKVAAANNVPIFKNDIDSFSYAVGMSVGQSLKDAGATNINSQLFVKAMNEIYGNKKTTFTVEQANTTIQQKLQAFQANKAQAAKLINDKFFAENKKRKGVIALPNGLQYEVLTAAADNAPRPTVADTVVVNYIGTLTNGKEFDNSYKRGQAARFSLNRVIRGWTEIVPLMPLGAKWKVYIPSDLAYGTNPPSKDIPANAILVFELSLEGIVPPANTEAK